jgi:uroporphyrinogen decarboxylase
LNRAERVLTVLEGKIPDRVPNVPMISFATAGLVGIKANAYYCSASAMAEAILAGLEAYGYDGVTIGGDLTVEAQALGMKTEFPEDQAPQVREPIVDSSKDLAKLAIPDPASSGRMAIFCEAVQTIREKTDGEVFIKSTTASPFVLAGHLLGIGNLMMFTVTERDFLNEVLAFCSKVVLTYAIALAEAGAHAVGFGAALASPDLLSPVDYHELVQPHEQAIIDAIHKKGCKHVMHICGNSLPIIDQMAAAGSDIIDLDQNVDIVDGKRAAGNRSTIRGNLDPVGVMLHGTKDQVFEAAQGCIEKGKPGGRFILAPGCTVDYHTPPENIRMLQRAVEEFGAY